MPLLHVHEPDHRQTPKVGQSCCQGQIVPGCSFVDQFLITSQPLGLTFQHRPPIVANMKDAQDALLHSMRNRVVDSRHAKGIEVEIRVDRLEVLHK